MGFQTCRNLSVLLLAGVALVGCNNTPDKPKNIGSGPNNLPGAAGLANQQQLQDWNQKPIPLKSATTSPQGGLQPAGNPLLGNTSGSNLPANTGFVPSGPGNVGAPPPIFTPMPTNPTTRPGNDVRTTAPSNFAADPFRVDPLPLPGGANNPIPIPQPGSRP